MDYLKYAFGFWKDLILGVVGIKPQTPTSAPISIPSFVPSAILLPIKSQISVEPEKEIIKQNLSGFNPNLIISDKEFLDCSSMTEKQIQDFMASRGSFLTTYSIQDRLVSYWIYKYCNDLGLNPKVLITHIQKEQGSISRTTTPTKQIKLDYFLGVGAYNNPIRFDEKWRGMNNQISGAVQVNIKRYNAALSIKFPYAYTSEKPEFRKLQIQNAATVSLYKYTPFVGDMALVIDGGKYGAPFGNLLFWKVWVKFFGAPV